MSKRITRKEFCVGAATMSVVPLMPVADGFSATPANPKKRALGQFNTEKVCWLRPQACDFIEKSGCSVAYDPFAGTGCLLKAVAEKIPTIANTRGLDIDTSLGWEHNDSLLKIPYNIENAVIVTNPPYISSYPARRKKINSDLDKYFASTCYDDVYLLALDRMLEAQRHVVAIIPETFINSPYRQKDKLSSITILEENPFNDTDTPVVVVCFDSVPKSFDEIKVYKNGEYVCTLGDVEQCRLVPNNSIKMKFNDPKGWLAVRCVDNTDPSDRLRFGFKQDIDYDWENGIKVSSRLLTLIEIDVPDARRSPFIAECNEFLEKIRADSHDIILSPFKGNMKNGIRRRRLDFMTCRAIVEKAYSKVVDSNCVSQTELF